LRANVESRPAQAKREETCCEKKTLPEKSTKTTKRRETQRGQAWPSRNQTVPRLNAKDAKILAARQSRQSRNRSLGKIAQN